MKSRTASAILGFFAFFAFALGSCGDSQIIQDDIVQQNVETYVKEQMNAPESYEFVALELIDTVTVGDNIDYHLGYVTSEIEEGELMLEGGTFTDTGIDPQYDDQIQTLKNDIARRKRILERIAELEADLAQRLEEAASYTYELTFRGNNEFGAPVLTICFVQTDAGPDFRVLNVTEEAGGMIPNPNDSTGLAELVRDSL